MEIYRCRRFTLETVEVTAHDGTTRVREKIVHPGAVVVLPVCDDGRLVLIRNRRFILGKTLLEVCAGTVEEGEPVERCAQRELTEETGYTAERMDALTGFYSSPGIMTERMHVFVARGLTAGPQALDDTEQIDVVLLSEEEVIAAIRDGVIEDAKSLVTLLLWLRARDLTPV